MTKTEKMEAFRKQMGHPMPGAGGAPKAWAPASQTGKRAKIPEEKKTKPNKFENMFLIDLMILRNSLIGKGAKCLERLGMADPEAGKHINELLELVTRMEEDMFETMPKSRVEYYDTLRRFGRYALKMEGPIRQGRTVLITDTYLSAVMEAAMESECLTCFRTGAEIDRCMIRKALLETSPPTEIRPDESETACEYRNCVGQLLRDETVTV